MSNPILIELTRGCLVESVHRGAVAVMRPSGEPVLALGPTDRPIFPRSAIKALQCLPPIETGAADRFGFGAAEIALACASHSGTDRHVAVAASMLERADLTAEALGCGAHMPLGEAAAQRLILGGRPPTALHNNCSGKHAGMLATAVHLGEPPDGYWKPEHPVQQRILNVLQEFTGQALGADVCSIDGCSAPNWAIPLRDLARAFACFVTGEGPAAPHRAAAERIVHACWQEPELVAGQGRLDTRLMTRSPGEVFVKTGAEGVYCGALPRLGLGLAIKIDDGAKRAAEAVLIEILRRLVPGTTEPAGGVLSNWHGLAVGEMRAAPALAAGLD
ncbi:MAG: asparaginase, partial [Hyphomicrobiaceae bacterium]